MKYNIDKYSKTILVIDGEDNGLDNFSRLLERDGYQVASAGDVERGLELVRELEPDLVITGDKRGDVNRRLAGQGSESDPASVSKMLVVTAEAVDGIEDYPQGHGFGANILINKNTDPREFLYQVESLLRLQHMERQLQTNEQRYRNLFENIRVGVAIYQAVDGGDDFRFVDVNPAAEEMIHTRRVEIIGQRVTQVFPGVAAIGLLDALKKVWHSGDPVFLENKYYRDDRIGFWVDNYVYRLSTGEVVALFQDMSKERRANTILRESEDRYRTLFTYTPIGLYRTTKDGDILDANPALVEMLGYPNRETLIEKSAFDVFVESDQRWEEIDILQKKDELHAQEIQVYRFDGSIIWAKDTARAIYDIKGNLSYFLGSLEDITAQVEARRKLQEYSDKLEDMVQKRTKELEQAQRQLLQQEKLAVLGQLAGGVGHDLRNPLGVISNSIYYLKMVMEDAQKEIVDYLDIIDEEVRTANSIVEDLLDFARTKDPVKEPIMARNFLEGLFVRFPPPDRIEVSVKIPDLFPKIWGDPKQLSTVFVNLVTNAYQSMEENGGLLTLRGEALDSDNVCIEVIDTGEGILAENIDNLFDPLFTTKARGVGLGLVTAKNLIEVNQGQLYVKSDLSSGTTFRVCLPVWKDYD